MKRFIYKILAFIIVLFLGLLFLKILTESIITKNADFKLKQKPNYIVIGHSYPECAYNDSIISGFVNLANSGEAYFYTYFKIKKIYEQNPSINNIFIEFTYNTISQTEDNKIWGDKYMRHRYEKYFSFMTTNDHLLLFKNNPKISIEKLLLSKENIKAIVKEDYNYIKKIGGYKYLERDKTDSILNSLDNKNNKTEIIKNKKFVLSHNLKYLIKIIKLCKENGSQVYLIRSPLHEKHIGRKNEDLFQEVRSNLFSDIEFLDFIDFPLKNSEFGDLAHLNYKGARVISTWFDQLLKKDILGMKDKELYIKELIKQKRIETNTSK